MRIALFVAPVALAVGLSACASGMGETRYETEYQRLAADCAARGGVLSPTGSQSGRPQLDNVCKITGQPSNR